MGEREVISQRFIWNFYVGNISCYRSYYGIFTQQFRQKLFKLQWINKPSYDDHAGTVIIIPSSSGKFSAKIRPRRKREVLSGTWRLAFQRETLSQSWDSHKSSKHGNPENGSHIHINGYKWKSQNKLRHSAPLTNIHCSITLRSWQRWKQTILLGLPIARRLSEQVCCTAPPSTNTTLSSALSVYYCTTALHRKLPLAPKISPGSHRIGGHSLEWYMPTNKKVSKPFLARFNTFLLRLKFLVLFKQILLKKTYFWSHSFQKVISTKRLDGFH